MKLTYLFIFVAFVFFSQEVFAQSNCQITSTLKVGSQGAEVQCLQSILGVTADGKFGPLTKAKLISFQSAKGLTADGIAGPVSRKILNVYIASLPNNGNYPAGCTSVTGYSPTTGIKCDGGLSPAPSMPLNKTIPLNPNLSELDKFIETVVEVNKGKGLSEGELSLMASRLKTEIIKSGIDYNKKFEEMLIAESKLSSLRVKKESLFSKISDKALSFLGIKPSVAQAVAGTPFGGKLLFSFFCAYNSSWMITISPLPPSYATLLTYYPGTQGFASFNIPFTSWLLGEYTPPGVCTIPGYPVIVIGTEGTINPMTGSSPF